jgi:plastocyanin
LYSNREEFIMSHENALKAQKSAWIIFIAAFLAGCSFGGPAYKEPIKNADAAVDMGFMSFNPATVTIRPDETVEWRSTSLITHTVTDDPKQAKNAGDATLPPGAAAIDSDDIAAGKTYLHTFSVPGTYHYFCEHHEKDGMVGTVIVRPAS